MHIAIIGTGRVAAALGRGWASKGHMVTFGSRQPESEKVAAMMAEMPPSVSVRPLRVAAENSSILVLAVPYSAASDALSQLGDLAGKVLVDCTNPIAPGLRPLYDANSSGAQHIAALAPQATVVKAFNTIGAEGMANPVFNGRAATMLLCGDDLLAKAGVSQLAEELGFEPVDAGPLAAARHLEALALLWIHLASTTELGRDIAFRLERR